MSTGFTRSRLRVTFILCGAAMISVSCAIWLGWHIAWLGLQPRELLGYWYSFVIFIAVLLVPLWIAMDLWIWRPLGQIDRANQHVGGDALQEAILADHVIPPNEIGELMRNHNAMVERLIRDTELRKSAEKRLRQSLQERETLVKEVHHRVKNNLQTVASLLSLQSQAIEEESVLQAFRDIQTRINSIATLHEAFHQSREPGETNLADYIRGLVPDLWASYAVAPDAIGLTLELDDVLLGLDRAIPCGLIINELVANALQHAFPNGRRGGIGIRLFTADGHVVLEVRDDGVGAPEAMDLRRPGTLGLTLVTDWVRQLQGTLDVANQGGADFTVRFPRQGRADA